MLKWLHKYSSNPLKAELNPICHLLALIGGHHILHVSRIRFNSALRCCKVKTVSYVKTTSVHMSSVCPSVCNLVAALNHFLYFYEIRCGSYFYRKLSSEREFCENRLLVVIIYFRS